MTVALHFTEELCNATWEKHTLGDHYILPIGNALCINAEAVARTVFTAVKIVRDKVASPVPDVDAVLIPSLAVIERDRPASVFSTQTTSILFNWSLNDKRGEPIWVTTILGEGKGPMGHPISKDSGREQVEKALNDVFQKSLQEISSSRAIREFAANRHRLNVRE